MRKIFRFWKENRLRYWYWKWTFVLVPDTETWFWLYTNWLNPRNHYSSGVLGTEFVVPFSSCSLDFKSSTFLSENIIIWVRKLPDFTQMMILSHNTSFWTKKRCYLMTFSWRLESERARVRGKLLNYYHCLLLFYSGINFCKNSVVLALRLDSHFWVIFQKQIMKTYGEIFLFHSPRIF